MQSTCPTIAKITRRKLQIHRNFRNRSNRSKTERTQAGEGLGLLTSIWRNIHLKELLQMRFWRSVKMSEGQWFPPPRDTGSPPPRDKGFRQNRGGLSPTGGSPGGGGGGPGIHMQNVRYFWGGGGAPPWPNTCQPILCIIGQSVACCWLQRLLDTLTCIDAHGVRRMMQISRICNALHPFISFLAAPTAE